MKLPETASQSGVLRSLAASAPDAKSTPVASESASAPELDRSEKRSIPASRSMYRDITRSPFMAVRASWKPGLSARDCPSSSDMRLRTSFNASSALANRNQSLERARAISESQSAQISKLWMSSSRSSDTPSSSMYSRSSRRNSDATSWSFTPISATTSPDSSVTFIRPRDRSGPTQGRTSSSKSIPVSSSRSSKRSSTVSSNLGNSSKRFHRSSICLPWPMPGEKVAQL